jgi:streptomycin 6-kinase
MATVNSFLLPRNLVAAVGSDPDEQRRAWMARLPTIVGELERRWSLEVSEPFEPGGQTAWVAPARDRRGRDLVLKVGWRHSEAEDEAAGLREWDGRGSVRLFAAEEQHDTSALLIERCRPGTSLASRTDAEQDMIIAGLMQRLWVEPANDAPFRPLQLMCEEWADEFEQKAAAGRSSIDPGLAREGIALFRSLPATADRAVLLCTDLHANNVLAAEREPWLVIDPKPYVGDPTYDPLQHLLNCEDRLTTDPVGLTQHMADLVGLSPDRLLLWLFARCVQESPDWPGLADVARRIAPS